MDDVAATIQKVVSDAETTVSTLSTDNAKFILPVSRMFIVGKFGQAISVRAVSSHCECD